MGLALVRTQAADAGVTALPHPSEDISSDAWFVYLTWLADVTFSTASGIQFDRHRKYEFDSKAMRKITDGDSMVTMLENDAAAGTGAQFFLQFRQLIMTG